MSFVRTRVMIAIEQPVTRQEVVKRTGLTLTQIKDGLTELKRYGQPVQAIGHGDNRHYYLPKHHQVPMKRQCKSTYLLDLITKNWVPGEELIATLDIEYYQMKNYIKSLRRKGWEISTRQSKRGMRMHEYKMTGKAGK
ncbi:hypothetical protein [Vibrio phage H188]|nr:hypothetical protein [Vibrio phage H188]